MRKISKRILFPSTTQGINTKIAKNGEPCQNFATIWIKCKQIQIKAFVLTPCHFFYLWNCRNSLHLELLNSWGKGGKFVKFAEICGNLQLWWIKYGSQFNTPAQMRKSHKKLC